MSYYSVRALKGLIRPTLNTAQQDQAIFSGALALLYDLFTLIFSSSWFA